MRNDDKRRKQFEGCVVAALETGAKLRRPEASANPSGATTDPIDRTIVTIEAESARIKAHALDTLFTQLASRAVKDGFVSHDMLRLALKAQSQSRTPLNGLSPAPARGNGREERQSQNSRKQTIET